MRATTPRLVLAALLVALAPALGGWRGSPTLHTLHASGSENTGTVTSATIPVASSEVVEVWLDVTAGSGNVAISVQTAPTSSGPWVAVGTITAKSNGQSGNVAVTRGQGSTPVAAGLYMRAVATVASAAATYTLYAITG